MWDMVPFQKSGHILQRIKHSLKTTTVGVTSQPPFAFTIDPCLSGCGHDVMSIIILTTSCRAENGSVNDKFVQQWDCELHLKPLQYI